MELIEYITTYLNQHIMADVYLMISNIANQLPFMGNDALTDEQIAFVYLLIGCVLTLAVLCFVFYCVYNVVMFVYRRVFKI